MEISFPCCKLLSDASDCLRYKSVGILKQVSHGTVDDDELSNPPKSIFEYVGVQGMEEQDASGGDDDNSREEKDDALTFDRNDSNEAVHEVLRKCASFPCHGKVSYSISSSDKEDDHSETALRQLFSEGPVQCPMSLPLVSAMKGSREKQGLPAKKLTVKWHPEVYDPPPTSVSHCISRGTKQQKGRKGKSKDDYKKNGKKGQKGSFPRSKEKKQHMQKVARNKSNRTIDGCSSAGSSGFQMGTTDYCGSSFLKKSVSNMHYPVAKAL